MEKKTRKLENNKKWRRNGEGHEAGAQVRSLCAVICSGQTGIRTAAAKAQHAKTAADRMNNVTRPEAKDRRCLIFLQHGEPIDSGVNKSPLHRDMSALI